MKVKQDGELKESERKTCRRHRGGWFGDTGFHLLADTNQADASVCESDLTACKPSGVTDSECTNINICMYSE